MRPSIFVPSFSTWLLRVPVLAIAVALFAFTACSSRDNGPVGGFLADAATSPQSEDASTTKDAKGTKDDARPDKNDGDAADACRAAAKPSGAACSCPAECASGFCTDGVCCNVACDGSCVSCALPGTPGECAPVAFEAPDPHGLCRRDNPTTCGQAGLCNGLGGCMKYSAETVATKSSCVDSKTLLPASTCDGDGQVIPAVAISCAPFTCENGACRSSCQNDQQCAGTACVGGTCGKRGNGQSCSAAAQCNSGFCIDGVCCDKACDGKCGYCAFPNSLGKCSAVAAGSADPRAGGPSKPADACVDQGAASCGTNGKCDGAFGCQKYAKGTTCKGPSCDPAGNREVAASTCDNGKCVAPAARSCAPFNGCSGDRCASGCSDNGQCVSPATCFEGSCGKRETGAQCSGDSDCGSGICSQGRCCSTRCDGSCKSCNVAGALGTCTNVPAGGADPAGTCKDDACTNNCDGMGGCRREPVGTACQSATCSAADTVESWTCNANAACVSATKKCAAAEVCTGGACVAKVKGDVGAACVVDDDCKTDLACTAGTCQAAKKANGSACNAASACKSGNCVEGVCCGAASCSACHSCSTGACKAVSNGTACTGGACNAGKCVQSKKAPGEACSKNGDCADPSLCIGGICCAQDTCSADCASACAATTGFCLPDITKVGAACGNKKRTCSLLGACN